ncbi:MAG: acyl-CoA dehydrogenase family protein [Lysinibacillus sp.]
MTLSTPTIDFIVRELTQQFAETASERDVLGGTAKEQRDLLRKSGLLGLTAPREEGGHGGDWHAVLAITRQFAQVDSSVAHLFGYHFLCLASVELYGSAEQAAFFAKETAEKNLFWGNAFNPRDTRVAASKTTNGWKVNGMKSFCSGASDSDRLLISAQKEDGAGPLIAVVPSDRSGISIHNDWDGFGQRQTDSGSVLFEEVEVKDEEVLDAYEQQPNSLFSTVRTHIAQSILSHVLLGTAEGAFEEAKAYTKTAARPWLTSNAATAGEDPYHLYHYGEFFVKLKAADALLQIANQALQHTWEQKHSITPEQRGECGIAIATAKIQVAQTALEVTSRMFEMMGARATSAKYNFDRYWRNVRTHTLHDPIDYKIRDVGQYALHQKYPDISPYS